METNLNQINRSDSSRVLLELKEMIGPYRWSPDQWFCQNWGPVELDRFTDPTPPEMLGVHSGPNRPLIQLLAYFIRFNLRGASLGAKAEWGVTWTGHSSGNGTG